MLFSVPTISSAARLAAVLEVGLCAPGSGETVARMEAPDRYPADEVRAALALSVAGSQKALDLAWAVCRRLPELHAAMAAGELDEQRAAAIVQLTEQLSDEHAHLICDEVLAHCLLSAAEPWVTGKVIAEVKKLAIALDPDWAERMYADAIRHRRVVGWRNSDGSADLAGQQLEADRVAATCGRLKELARKAKKDGDPRPIDQLRADLFTGMLDGTFEGLSAEQILEELAKTRPNRARGGTRRRRRCRPADSEPAPPGSAAAAAHRAAVPAIGVQLRCRLSTLLGRDQYPADLAGWGPMDAVHARALAQQLSHGTWRFALLDEQGRLALTGLCTARPEGWRPRKAWAKRRPGPGASPRTNSPRRWRTRTPRPSGGRCWCTCSIPAPRSPTSPSTAASAWTHDPDLRRGRGRPADAARGPAPAAGDEVRSPASACGAPAPATTRRSTTPSTTPRAAPPSRRTSLRVRARPRPQNQGRLAP